ncbi:uncharacterized protein LOC112639010 [Camponotus floridanus]|uniref:uncharacterized protein LOC112639010 n=1 Tax=Camponotus floridanus TaxID=104421 RepID=UPI000DC67650|nr:uncharacterized protein LOC112639010 [Camponotus floridanus]
MSSLSVSQPPCCLPTCLIPCSVICCTPPVSYPCMPYVPRVQCRIACRPQSAPKPIKAVVYLPSCPMSNPLKMEVTYLPSSSLPSSPCFYVCKTNYVPCNLPKTDTSKPIAMNRSSCKILGQLSDLVPPVKKVL